MPLLSFARAYVMPIGVYDIETRSTVNLTLCGAWNYAAHPSTSILCMYLAVDDGEPERWLPGDPIPYGLHRRRRTSRRLETDRA